MLNIKDKSKCVLVIFKIQILMEDSIIIKTFLQNEEVHGAKCIWNWSWYTHNSKLHPIFSDILPTETEVVVIQIY